MKKMYVLLFVTAGIFKIAHAQDQQDLQFKKGDKLLGGSVSFVDNNFLGSGNNASLLSVNPSLGFFTRPNRLTGFSILAGSDFNAQHTFGASVYKQYWNHLGKNVYFIMQGEIAGTYNRSVDYNSPSSFSLRHTRDAYTLSASVYPGFAYRINRRLLVDAFLPNFISVSDTYSKLKIDYYNSGATTTTKFSSNGIRLSSALNGFSFNNIQFGFRYILK